MKKYWPVVISILILPLFSFAQDVNLRNNSLTEPSLNLLYLGFQNEIKAEGIDSRYLQLIINDSIRVIQHGYTNQFTYSPEYDFKNSRINIKLYNDTLLVTERDFEVRTIADPVICIGRSQPDN